MNTMAARFKPTRLSRFRAVVMLEFAIILPLVLFMLLLSIDFARMTLTASAVNEITFSTARKIAQQGGSVSTTEANDIYQAYLEQGKNSGAIVFSGTQSGDPGVASFTVQPSNGTLCQSGTDYVTVTVDYNFRWLTPTVGAFSNWLSGTGPGGYNMRSVASARCEIVPG